MSLVQQLQNGLDYIQNNNVFECCPEAIKLLIMRITGKFFFLGKLQMENILLVRFPKIQSCHCELVVLVKGLRV